MSQKYCTKYLPIGITCPYKSGNKCIAGKCNENKQSDKPVSELEKIFFQEQKYKEFKKEMARIRSGKGISDIQEVNNG